MDAGGAADESAGLWTAKSCGPDASMVGVKLRGRKLPRGDGDNKARSPGRVRRKPLKPSRAGMPGDSGATVVTNARAFYTPRAAAGASGTRHSPRPLLGGSILHNSGASRRGMAEVYLSYPRHCDPVARNDDLLSVVARVSGRSSIPMIEPRSCGVLDTPLSRSMTASCED